MSFWFLVILSWLAGDNIAQDALDETDCSQKIILRTTMQWKGLKRRSRYEKKIRDLF